LAPGIVLQCLSDHGLLVILTAHPNARHGVELHIAQFPFLSPFLSCSSAPIVPIFPARKVYAYHIVGITSKYASGVDKVENATLQTTDYKGGISCVPMTGV